MDPVNFNKDLSDEEIRNSPEYQALQTRFEEWYTSERRVEDNTFVIQGVPPRVAILFLADRQNDLATGSVQYAYEPAETTPQAPAPAPSPIHEAAVTESSQPIQDRESVAPASSTETEKLSISPAASSSEQSPSIPSASAIKKPEAAADKHKNIKNSNYARAFSEGERVVITEDKIKKSNVWLELNRRTANMTVAEARNYLMAQLTDKTDEDITELRRQALLLKLRDLPPLAPQTTSSSPHTSRGGEKTTPAPSASAAESVVNQPTVNQESLPKFSPDALRQTPEYQEAVLLIRDHLTDLISEQDPIKEKFYQAFINLFGNKDLSSDKVALLDQAMKLALEDLLSHDQLLAAQKAIETARRISQDELKAEQEIVDAEADYLLDLAGVPPPPAESLASTKRVREQISQEQTAAAKIEIFQSEPFQFLSQLAIKGMTYRELRQLCAVSPDKYKGPAWVKKYLEHPLWTKAASTFRQALDEGFSPAANFMLEYVLAHPQFTNYQELNADSQAEARQKFIEVTKHLWGKFYYSGKWTFNSKKGEYELSKDADLDAKVSLALFKRAGIKEADLATAIPPGQRALGGVVLDSGGLGGVGFETTEAITQPQGPISIMTLVADNHQPYRDLVETSTAKIVYNLLTEAGILDKRDLTARVLADLTVMDDNAHLIETREQLEKSSRTLRGLHRFFNDIDDLQGFVMQLLDRVKRKVPKVETRGGKIYKRPWQDYYADIIKAVLDSEIDHNDIVSLKLGKTVWREEGGGRGKKQKKVRLWKYADQIQQETINNAQELLSRSDDELRQAGQLLEIPGWGRTYIEIGGLHKRLLGGHDALKAYGFDMGIRYDEKEKSFLINLLKPSGDLSEKFQDLPQGMVVRGVMVMKPRDGRPLQISLDDLLLRAGLSPEQIEQYKQTLKDLKATTSAAPTHPESAVRGEHSEITLGIEFTRSLSEQEINLYQTLITNIRRALRHQVIPYLLSRDYPQAITAEDKQAILTSLEFGMKLKKSLDLIMAAPESQQKLRQLLHQRGLPVKLAADLTNKKK